MHNAYQATLPEGYAGFRKAHLGQCSLCVNRLVTELPFGNRTRGEVHLCTVRRTELGIEGDGCGTTRRCRLFALTRTPDADAS